nr:aminotransferase class III-fold pyridoxal phosphate-dependent enzyme [Mobilicoccus caccae]
MGAVAERSRASGHMTDDDPLAALVARLEPAMAATRVLPAAVQHADVTLTNVLVTDGAITGIVDFGDMHHTPFVADVAASLTSVLRNTAAEQPCTTWQLAGAYLRGYQRHRLLTRAEVDVLGELILARMVVSTLISRTRAAVHVDNTDYITRYDAANERVLGALTALTPAELAARFHRLAGTGDPAIPVEEVPARRAAAMGGRAAPLFYRQPLHMVEGDGPWLVAADGRRYLDAYNNVAVVGHGDPVVTNRITRQLNRLNTNSRYLHAGIVELAERLLATMPDGLDTCLFTTSGTEANELAWRLATEATGGDGALIVERSYHGTTKWMADLSSNEWPPGHRPSRVARFPAPRGPGQDAETASRGVRDATADLAERGHRPALLLADSGFTSEGVHDAPANWFHGLADATREAGALYLADEVQIGYGRTGPLLWRFRQAEVTPDFVTLGKPMGAGYPIGAMITRRELVDRFAEKYEYFSTFAATPAAAAAGLAVLDVLAERELPQQAVEVGAHLVDRLAALAETSPCWVRCAASVSSQASTSWLLTATG